MGISSEGNQFKKLVEKRSAGCRKLASSIRKDSKRAGLKPRERRYLERLADQLDDIGDGMTESMSTDDMEAVRAWFDRARWIAVPIAAALGAMGGGFAEGFGAAAYEGLFGEDTVASASELTGQLYGEAGDVASRGADQAGGESEPGKPRVGPDRGPSGYGLEPSFDPDLFDPEIFGSPHSGGTDQPEETDARLALFGELSGLVRQVGNRHDLGPEQIFSAVGIALPMDLERTSDDKLRSLIEAVRDYLTELEKGRRDD